jgi:hypothetical protein
MPALVAGAGALIIAHLGRASYQKRSEALQRTMECGVHFALVK